MAETTKGEKDEKVFAKVIFIGICALSFGFISFCLQEPKALDNKPYKTVEVKFVEKRALRMNLGRDAEMRLAIQVGRLNQPAISVICPREFVAESGKLYFVNSYKLRDEDGNVATNLVWILGHQPPEKSQSGLTP